MAIMSDYLKGIMDEIYNPQTTAAQAAYDTTVGNINTQIAGANQAYQPQRNQAYVQALMADRARQENMANMGYSAGGGMSQTLQQRDQNAMLSNLANINLAQKDYINQLETEARNAALTRDTTMAGIQADRGQATLNQYNTDTARADQLYAAGIISAAQYQSMTGITPVKRGGGGGGDTKYEDYLYAIKMGMSPDEARALSGYVPNNYSGSVSGSGGRTYYVNGQQVDYNTWATQYNPMYT